MRLTVRPHQVFALHETPTMADRLATFVLPNDRTPKLLETAVLVALERALDARRVLEIGTGCGYQAALLAHLCREVYSMERLRPLHERARENLRPLRIPNVHLIFGDGTAGYPQGAPYAGIIAAAGGADIPTPWLEQLAVGARLVAPAELAPGRQSLVVVDRTAVGYERRVLEGVWFVPLKSGVA